MRSFTTEGQNTAHSSSMMINRRRPEDKDPIIIITSSVEGTPSKDKGAKRSKLKGSPHRRKPNNNWKVLLGVVSIFVFGYILGNMVDLSFLGGFFLIGLRSPNANTAIKNRGNKREFWQNDATAEVNSIDTIQYEIEEFPNDWEEYSYNDIRDHFDCRSRSQDNAKPLPSLQEWQYMRNTFTKVVDPTNTWDDPVPPTLGYSLEPGTPIPPPYYAKFSAGKGRGLFASRNIKKGELVHDGSVSDVIFPNAMAWRQFVFSLPREMACDCTDWHWMQKLEEGGEYFMVAGINISSLMNSGGEEFGGERLPNALPNSSISGKFYAVRDIREGDEVLTDYDVYYTHWKKVGL